MLLLAFESVASNYFYYFSFFSYKFLSLHFLWVFVENEQMAGGRVQRLACMTKGKIGKRMKQTLVKLYRES